MFGITAVGCDHRLFHVAGQRRTVCAVGHCAAPCPYGLQIAGADYSHRGAACPCRFAAASGRYSVK